jgi:hypothetical protein
MNTDPQPTNPEQNGGSPEALLQLISSLLAQQGSPEAYNRLMQLLGGLGTPLLLNPREAESSAREDMRLSRYPKFRSAQAGILLEQVYPSKPNLSGFGIPISGNSRTGLLAPGLPITPTGIHENVQDLTLDSMSNSRDSVHINGVPSLPKAILDRRHGFDATVKPTNKGLVEISLESFKYLRELLALPLSDRALVSILTPLLVRDFWNNNKSDPGGNIMALPEISQGEVDITNLLGNLTPRGSREVVRILPHFRRWLRLIQTQATAGLALMEGDPFSGNMDFDPTIQELAVDLSTMRRLKPTFEHIPLLRDSVMESRKHPLKKYAHAMKSWNTLDWERLIDQPELLSQASSELKKLRSFKTVMIAAGTGAGKSTLANRMIADRRLLLGENDPGSRERFLGIGNAVIGISSAGRGIEAFKADSPFELLFSAIDRSLEQPSGTPDNTLILMEIPPTVSLGMPEGEARRKNMSRQEIAQMTCYPPHIAMRLMRNGTQAEDLFSHDPGIATISSIALSRIAAGNIEGIALPMRRNNGTMDTIARLSRLQPDGSDVWSAESTLSYIRDVYSALPADIKALWWMSSITDAPLVPIVREFPGELTRDDMYNNDLGAVHYLLSLHNLGIFDLHADSNVFPKEIGKFLPDGKINLRKLALKIPQDSPLRVLVTIAGHLKDNLHGSGITNTSQFLYGLALSLHSLSSEKNVRI